MRGYINMYITLTNIYLVIEYILFLYYPQSWKLLKWKHGIECVQIVHKDIWHPKETHEIGIKR